jgi:hypothetical protein
MISHTDQRVFAGSRIPQTNYLTRTPSVAANYKQVITTEQGFGSVKAKTNDNRDHANGKGQPTSQWVDSHETERKFEIQVCSEEIGRPLLDALGKVVSSQPDAANVPAARRHLFTPMDLSLSKQLPARSFIEQDGDAIDRILCSMVAESLEISGDDIGRIMASVSYAGSGEIIEPSGVVITLLDALHFFYNSQAVMTVDDGGGEFDYSAGLLLNSWKLSITNELLKDQGYRPGARRYLEAANPESGALRSEMLVARQTFGGGFNVRLAAGSKELTALRAQTPLAWKVDLLGELIGSHGGTDYCHQLTIEVVKAQYKTTEYGNKGGIVSVDVDFNPLADIATGDQLKITLQNTVASYTV